MAACMPEGLPLCCFLLQEVVLLTKHTFIDADCERKA